MSSPAPALHAQGRVDQNSSPAAAGACPTTPEKNAGLAGHSARLGTSTPGGPGLFQVVRGRLWGSALPLLVFLLSLLLMAIPLLAMAQTVDPAGVIAPSGPQSWVALLAGFIGALSGGGSLYKVQSSASSTETRIAKLEEAQKTCLAGLSDRFVRRDEVAQIYAALERSRRESREDIAALRGEVAELRTQSASLSRQNELIIAALDKLGKV